jgi:hypothetical protein
MSTSDHSGGLLPPPLEVIRKRTPQSFLDYIRPDASHWSRGRWIFRGQADARWGLVPAAFRQDQLWRLTLLTTSYHFGGGIKGLLLHQLVKEVSSIAAFLSLADEVGVDSPWSDLVDIEFRKLHSQIYDSHVKQQDLPDFPPATLRAVFALAQHHGLPTRLLDWTRSPHAAAFFAACDPVAREGKSKALAVWAANLDWLPTARIETFSSSYGNRFQRAQKGVFTWDLKANDAFLRDQVWPSQEAAFFDFADPDENNSAYLEFDEEGVPRAPSASLLRKVILPAAASDELLMMLFRLDVSRAHLMPTLSNVVATLLLNGELRDEYRGHLEAIEEAGRSFSEEVG